MKISAHQKYICGPGPYAGLQVPGVTTVLGVLDKPALIYWAWDLGMKGLDYRKVRDKAADIGTIAHYMIECDLKGVKPELDDYAKADIDKAENAFLAWLEWRKNNIAEFTGVELQLTHDELGYGGTIDGIARKSDGKVVLIDFKTSKAVYDTMIAQCSAYKVMYERKGLDQPIQEVHLLRLDKEDGYPTDHLISPPKLMAGWDLFVGALKCYRALKKLKS